MEYSAFMNLKIGIDVGGTFTDFIVTGHGPDALIHKVLSTPKDSSIAVLAGLREIAQRMQISEHTVKFHVSSILGKLGAATRTEAVTRGYREGLILI